jgi:uncharacterized OsmC-like protein
MYPRTTKHSVVATHAGGEAFAVDVRGHTVRTDQPRSAGGSDSGPTPLELLSVSLASCIALYVHRFCVRNGLHACGLNVEVSPVWRSDPGRIARFDVQLHLPASVPHHLAGELEAVARSCPVHLTFSAPPQISVHAVIAPAADRPTPLRGSAPRRTVAVGQDA